MSEIKCKTFRFFFRVTKVQTANAVLLVRSLHKVSKETKVPRVTGVTSDRLDLPDHQVKLVLLVDTVTRDNRALLATWAPKESRANLDGQAKRDWPAVTVPTERGFPSETSRTWSAR